MGWSKQLHSKNKKYFQTPFSGASQIGDFCQCLEGPISSTWKDHNRNLESRREEKFFKAVIGPYSY